MKNINVKILASPHPQFDEILDFPPRGVTYEIDRVKTKYHGWITENKIKFHNLVNKIISLPRMASTKATADIIHSTRGIIQVKQKKPWIIDCENGDVFTSFNRKAMKRPLVRKIIMSALTSRQCKKILPQSQAAREDLKMALGEKNFNKIKHKVEVLYLAMHPYKKSMPKKKGDKVVLSFVGREFYNKGGHDLFSVFKELRKKYGKKVEFKFKGDVPERFKKVNLPGMKFIEGFLSRDELFEEMYLGADIFVMPTHTDNYGVVFLEAMSVGMPIVGTTSFTVPELIEDGGNGFLIKTPHSWENYIPHGKSDEDLRRALRKPHPEIRKQLFEKLCILIEDKKLREKMGKRSREIIGSGKLSIKKRNKQLRKIYEEALK